MKVSKLQTNKRLHNSSNKLLRDPRSMWNSVRPQNTLKSNIRNLCAQCYYTAYTCLKEEFSCLKYSKKIRWIVLLGRALKVSLLLHFILKLSKCKNVNSKTAH